MEKYTVILLSKLRYLLLMLLLLPLQSCAFYYSAAPIEAWVVDAETGKPLEGVIVSANWQLKAGKWNRPLLSVTASITIICPTSFPPSIPPLSCQLAVTITPSNG